MSLETGKSDVNIDTFTDTSERFDSLVGHMTLDQIFRDDENGLLEVRKSKLKSTANNRLVESFVEICDFVREKGREPALGSKDVHEGMLASRLGGIRLNESKVSALREFDSYGLLEHMSNENLTFEEIMNLTSESLLLDRTGVLDTSSLPQDEFAIERKGESAHRTQCKDFDRFKGLFIGKQEELRNGFSKLVPFAGRHRIVPGAFFIHNGVMVFVAEVGDVEYKRTTVRENRRERLRLIYENGTESGMYRQSLSLRLGEAGSGYEVVPSDYEMLEDSDQATGWIYVLKSLSSDPQIVSRVNLHKIGFSRNPVAQRIANAKSEPTYLMAPVRIECEYRTYNLKTSALEHLLHRIFAEVKLDMSQVGKDGRKYDTTEWFDVPLGVIDQAIHLVVSGEITNLVYDPKIQKLVERSS